MLREGHGQLCALAGNECVKPVESLRFAAQPLYPLKEDVMRGASHGACIDEPCNRYRESIVFRFDEVRQPRPKLAAILALDKGENRPWSRAQAYEAATGTRQADRAVAQQFLLHRSDCRTCRLCFAAGL